MKKLFLPLAVLLIFATSCDKNDDNPATPTDPVENLLIGQWSIDPQVVLVDSTQDSIKETPVSVDDSSYANISDTGTVQLGIYIVGNDIFKGAVWQYEMINDSLLSATDTSQTPATHLNIAIKTLAEDSAVIVPNLTSILGPGQAAVVTL